MSRLTLSKETAAQAAMDVVLRDIERRLYVSPFGNCPVRLAASVTRLCAAQSCGKCAPCRVGLPQLGNLMDDILGGKADEGALALLEKTAAAIYDSADCAIGYEAANTVLNSLRGFRDDYENHLRGGACAAEDGAAVPCAGRCPAHVDIPGYISLVADGRYDDALALIRKDNPFPTACGLICEHPCEARCRRGILDAPINIRGLKRVASDNAGSIVAPKKAKATGKTVGVVGGGPAGLTAAYFLSLMGHSVTVYEKRAKLGGMLRYGIPGYRLPREELQRDIDAILAAGVAIEYGADVGGGLSLMELRKKHDAMFIAIGAHTEKKLGIEGENLGGVMSAVQMLRAIGDGNAPDFTGKRVIVVGGGNVAMDVARSSVRLGAANVAIAYRRRQEDMTALPEEVEGAIAEGVEILTMEAPVRMEGDAEDRIVALWTQPQIVGAVEDGRPKPVNADKPQRRVPCDLLVLAIGQDIESVPFAAFGMKTRRGAIQTRQDGSISELPGVFAGGDCATGPATVIRAIEAGKVAAANIDDYLGCDHKISVDIEIPPPKLADKPRRGRVNMQERAASERRGDFALMEHGMSGQEAKQEAERCLRCDLCGYGSFRGGRVAEW